MRKVNLALAIGTLGMLAAPSHAIDDQPFLIRTAGDLAQLCGTPTTDERHEEAIHMCEGYFVGAHQLHTAFMSNSKTGGIYCYPESGGPTRNQVAAEFVVWMNETPDAARLPAIEGFMRWASTRFPCP